MSDPSPSENNLGEFLRDFIMEARDHLGQAEQCLLRLSDHPDDEAAIHACFRSLHSIKGGAGFLGQARIQALAHAAEQLLDRMRTGGVRCGPAHIEVMLQTVSRLEDILAALENNALGAA